MSEQDQADRYIRTSDIIDGVSELPTVTPDVGNMLRHMEELTIENERLGELAEPMVDEINKLRTENELLKQSCEWVSVNDKLPKEDVSCIIQYYDGAVGFLPYGGKYLTQNAFNILRISKWKYSS